MSPPRPLAPVHCPVAYQFSARRPLLRLIVPFNNLLEGLDLIFNSLLEELDPAVKLLLQLLPRFLFHQIPEFD